MMQDGLQVGIAAWVSGRRGGDDFVVWPALPLPAALEGIEAVASMGDLARAAEFAHLVNFVPRKGRYAEPFAPDGVLWEVHRGLLLQMSFATRTWTAAEEGERKAAAARLYEAGPEGPRMTRGYKRYEECRAAYADLLVSGADPDELARAFAEWVVNGKVEIEVALATLGRLAQRSTVPLAGEQQAQLDPTLLAATADGSYAATEFAPLTAVRPDTWLSAEVTFDELEGAIGGSGPRDKWSVWRGGRTGTVRFRFAALDLRRSWFAQSIYAADDWRLAGEPVSTGDGVGGRLPAFVTTVYLAIVDEVRVTPKPKPDPHQTPPIFVPPHYPDNRFNGQLSLSRFVTGPGLAAPRPLAAAVSLRLGVARVQAADPPGVSDAVRVALRPNPLGVVTRPSRAVLMTDRLALADTLARSGGSATPPPRDAAFVVGFGCTSLPASPRPNPEYLWPFN